MNRRIASATPNNVKREKEQANRMIRDAVTSDCENNTPSKLNMLPIFAIEFA